MLKEHLSGNKLACNEIFAKRSKMLAFYEQTLKEHSERTIPEPDPCLVFSGPLYVLQRLKGSKDSDTDSFGEFAKSLWSHGRTYLLLWAQNATRLPSFSQVYLFRETQMLCWFRGKSAIYWIKDLISGSSTADPARPPTQERTEKLGAQKKYSRTAPGSGTPPLRQCLQVEKNTLKQRAVTCWFKRQFLQLVWEARQMQSPSHLGERMRMCSREHSGSENLRTVQRVQPEGPLHTVQTGWCPAIGPGRQLGCPCRGPVRITWMTEVPNPPWTFVSVCTILGVKRSTFT